MGVGGQRHAPAALPPGKNPVTIVQEAGWAPGPVWTGAENLAPPGFDPRTVQPAIPTELSRPPIMLSAAMLMLSEPTLCSALMLCRMWSAPLLRIRNVDSCCHRCFASSQAGHGCRQKQQKSSFCSLLNYECNKTISVRIM